MQQKLLKFFYDFGLLKTFRNISRIRYLRRLTKNKSHQDLWYYIENDKNQYSSTDDLLIYNLYKDVRFSFLCNPKDLIERDVLTQGMFRKHILDYMHGHATNGSIVIDAGANVGIYTIPLAKSRSDIEIHAFEPHPEVSERLENNLRLNRLSNVKRHQLGLSDISGKTIFNAVTAGQENLGLSSISPVSSGVKVNHLEIKVDTLDNLFLSTSQPISVIKIDVQGHELNVLHGACKLIERDLPVIILEHEDSNFTILAEALCAKKGLGDFFHALGYEVFYISLFDPSMLFPVKWDQRLEGDLLALPTKGR